LEDAHEKVWAAKECERNRDITMRMEVLVRPAGAEFEENDDQDVKEEKAFEEFMNSAVDYGAEIRLGMPVHARYGGLAFYYPGCIFQVSVLVSPAI